MNPVSLPTVKLAELPTSVSYSPVIVGHIVTEAIKSL
jgi:hypothetical protein